MSLRKSLADLAAALDKTGNERAEWKKFFPFYKADAGTTTIFRFFPDANIDNPMGFLIENLVHDLPQNGKRNKLACLRMYGEDCPICKQSARHFDKNSVHHDDELGRALYRKRSYIGQGMVISAPFNDASTDVLRLIEFGPKIFACIRTAFANGDMDVPPYEFKGGHNFRIVKTKSGEYPDYGSSTFSPKQGDVDLAVVESLTLYDLAEHRAPRVSLEVLEAALFGMKVGGAPPTPALPPSAEVAASPTSSTILDRLRAKRAEEERKSRDSIEQG